MHFTDWSIPLANGGMLDLVYIPRTIQVRFAQEMEPSKSLYKTVGLSILPRSTNGEQPAAVQSGNQRTA